MPLYSPQSAAEQYLQQTGGLFGTEFEFFSFWRTSHDDLDEFLFS